MTYIKNHGVATTRQMLSDGTQFVRERHLPPTEWHDLRAEFHVRVIQKRASISHGFSLRCEVIKVSEVVLVHERTKVSLVDHEQSDLWIKRTELSDLLVLLRDQSLLEHREFDEQTVLVKIEVWSKRTHGLA
jgi:hypothetical protein